MIYSTREVLRLLYCILCAEKFTYWSKATPQCQLLVRGLKEDTEVRGDGAREEDYVLIVITDEKKMTLITCKNLQLNHVI